MNNSIDLNRIKQVRDTNLLQNANAYLDAGWVLLKASVLDTFDSTYDVVYVFGWNKESEPVEPLLTSI